MRSNGSNATSHFNLRQWLHLLADEDLQETRDAFHKWLASLGVDCAAIHSQDDRGVFIR